MATSSLSKARQTEREVYVTTSTAEEKPGSGPASKKALRLRQNPRIRLAFGGRAG